MQNVNEIRGEIKPRLSLELRLSPVALGITPAILNELPPVERAIRLRSAAEKLILLADELVQGEQ